MFSVMGWRYSDAIDLMVNEFKGFISLKKKQLN